MTMTASVQRRPPFFSRSWIGIDTGAEPALTVARFVCGRPRERSLLLRDASPALRRSVAEGARCAVALPAAAGLVVRLTPPDLPPAKRRRILPALLDLQLPFPVDQCCCAFVDAPGDTVALAARQEDLRAALAAWAEQSIDPARVQPLPWMLWTQALREFPPADDSQRRAVLWTASDRWVVVVGQGSRFGSMAAIPTRTPEALRRTLQMAFGEAASGCLLLCAGAEAAEAARKLAPWPEPWHPTVCPVEEPAFFLARALATDAALDGEGGGHVRQAPLEHPRAASAAPRALRWATVALAATAVLLCAASWRVRRLVADREAVFADRLSDRLESLAGYPVRTRGARAVQEAREALDARLDPWVERMRKPGAAKTLAVVLDAARSSAVQITHLAVAPEGPTLSGRAATATAAREFEAALRSAGSAVRMEIDPNPGDDGRAAFLLTPEVVR